MKRIFLMASLVGAFIFTKAQTVADDKVHPSVEEAVDVAVEAADEAMEAVEEVEEMVKPAETYTVTSIVENSGYQQTVGFEGAWKLDCTPDNRLMIITGGAVSNKAETPSNKMRLMVYLAEKPFDLNNPDFIGKMYAVTDIDELDAGGKDAGQVLKMSWTSEEHPEPGTYYPYILLGEQKTGSEEFEVRDVKAFAKSFTIND